MNNRLWMIAVAAGLCGGVAEMAWVGLYTYGSPVPPSGVARQIAATVFPGGAGAWATPLTGVGIHLALSAVLGIVFVAALRALSQAPAGRVRAQWAWALGALSAVWAVNFLWLLPALNPAFPALLPYGVTLASKLLFAVAMVAVLHACRGIARPGPGRESPCRVAG